MALLLTRSSWFYTAEIPIFGNSICIDLWGVGEAGKKELGGGNGWTPPGVRAIDLYKVTNPKE